MRRWTVCAILTLGAATMAGAAEPWPAGPLWQAETTFVDALDASNAVAAIDSGLMVAYAGRNRGEWQRTLEQRRAALDAELDRLKNAALLPADAEAVTAMRRSLAALDALVPSDAPEHACAESSRRDLGYGALRAALVSCFIEIGNHLQFEGQPINRGLARTLLAELDQPARRKALFASMQPLWSAVNGANAADSPYRRMIAMAAADGARNGSEIDAAARAVGADVAELERWLVRILEAWSDASGTDRVEPWDFTYVASEGSRRVSERVPARDLARLNERFYADLGADPRRLGVVFDLAPRPDKSSVAYTDFLRRGRLVDGAWQRSVARVVGTYTRGGLFELNELVHESGHAAHVSAIRARPAHMDWPESLFCEAFADVPSWSVYEPAWQRRYLGVEIPESASLRALFGNVMLDVAWSLFELRMLRAPDSDPNAVWTDITSRYLHIVPHPELSWWVMRVQLVESPGYMVNYGLGAVLTAEMRQHVTAAIGPFDTGNPRWYPWLTENLLRFGTERDTRQLLVGLLGRPPSPDALLRQLRRIKRVRE